MATYIDQSMKQWEFEYRKDHTDTMRRFEKVLALAKHITPKQIFNVSIQNLSQLHSDLFRFCLFVQQFSQKQSELCSSVERVENVLLDGFKASAQTELEHKISRDEAEQMLTNKYDVETALVVESSVTDCVIQVQEMYGDIEDLRTQIQALQEQQLRQLEAQQQ